MLRNQNLRNLIDSQRHTIDLKTVHDPITNFKMIKKTDYSVYETPEVAHRIPVIRPGTSIFNRIHLKRQSQRPARTSKVPKIGRFNQGGIAEASKRNEIRKTQRIVVDLSKNQKGSRIPLRSSLDQQQQQFPPRRAGFQLIASSLPQGLSSNQVKNYFTRFGKIRGFRYEFTERRALVTYATKSSRN